MRLKQESEKIMTVCAKKGKRENDVFFSLFVVLMYTGYHCRECRTTNLCSKAKQLTTRVTMCTYAQFAKKKHFHDFLGFSVMSIHRN